MPKPEATLPTWLNNHEPIFGKLPVSQVVAEASVALSGLPGELTMAGAVEGAGKNWRRNSGGCATSALMRA